MRCSFCTTPAFTRGQTSRCNKRNANILRILFFSSGSELLVLFCRKKVGGGARVLCRRQKAWFLPAAPGCRAAFRAPRDIS